MRTNIFQNNYDAMTRKDTKYWYENPREFPLELHIELTNACNLRCEFCPTGNHTMKRKVGFMKEYMFWAICTEAYKYGADLRLIRFGEPTLHTLCYDYIRMAKKVGLNVHMNTNGIGLDVKEVISSGLDSIKISVHNRHAIKPFKKLMQARGEAEKPFITLGQMDKDVEFFPPNREKYKADATQYGIVKDLKHGNRAPSTCWELYHRLSINWDGTVVACCGSWDNQMCVGKLYRETLKEIWDGDAIQRYRDMEQKGRLDQVPLCQKCAR